MRVVIDGTPLQDDDHLARVLSRLLQVWNEPAGIDELHLAVGSPLHIPVPDWVTVHEVRSARRGRLGRFFATALRVPWLCRSVRAQAVLALRPSALATALQPRHIVRYDLWQQPGSEQFAGSDLELDATGIAWAGFARRLRVSMVDAVADADWHARRFKINPALLWTRPAANVAGVRRLQIPHRRSVRLIAAASLSTLALSAAAAASVDLVASHNFPVDTPHVTTTSVTTGNTETTGTTHGSLPGVVQMPVPSTTAPTGTAAPTTSSPTTASTAAPATKAPSATNSTPLTLPTLTLPTVTLPTVTLPSLPLPTLPSLPSLNCSSTTSTTSLLGVNLCNLNLHKG